MDSELKPDPDVMRAAKLASFRTFAKQMGVTGEIPTAILDAILPSEFEEQAQKLSMSSVWPIETARACVLMGLPDDVVAAVFKQTEISPDNLLRCCRVHKTDGKNYLIIKDPDAVGQDALFVLDDPTKIVSIDNAGAAKDYTAYQTIDLSHTPPLRVSYDPTQFDKLQKQLRKGCEEFAKKQPKPKEKFSARLDAQILEARRKKLTKKRKV